MLTRFALWVRFFFPLFARVEVDRKWEDTVRDAATGGRLVHVIEVEGLLDFALLNYLLLRRKLPVAAAANTRVNSLLKPLLLLLLYPFVWLARVLSPPDRVADFVRELNKDRAGLIFLKRARFVMLPGGNIGHPFLQALVELQREDQRPITLVPHVIFWTKGPEKYRKSALDLLLGDPNAPGLRKLLTFLLRTRRTQVTCARPIPVCEAYNPEEPDEAPETVARRLSWLIHRAIDEVEKVTRGPMLKNAHQMRNEMLANPEFLQGVEEAGTQMGLNPATARERAGKVILEIAADFRNSYIEFLSFVLTPIFKRVFSSFVVDRDAIQTIKEAAKDSAVILVPCHRSHIDYLVISYLMYLLGVNPPHIAAGANLSFFPMGHIFRHSGAFFIRRSIGGDRVYAYVLAHYIRKLIKEGHSIEFFIEGGRSRTGKTLPPRFGLLGYVADAVMAGAVHNVKVIPIALSYERIMEVEGYARELSGGDKRKEDLSGLVKSAEVLDSRYGRLYLTAGRPIHVTDFFRKTLAKEPQEITEEEKRYLVKKLGYLILNRINRATVVNPSGLVAGVLLSHHRRGISEARFLELSGFLLDFAIKRGYPASLTMEQALKAARQDLVRGRERAASEETPRLAHRVMGRAIAPILNEAIERFATQRHVATETYDEGPVIFVRPASRMYLNYYRNNILHVYQREALVALSLVARRDDHRIRIADIETDVQFLSELLRREFIFRVGDFQRGIAAALQALQKAEMVALAQDGEVTIVHANFDLLSLFRNMVLPIVESYLICARYTSLVRFKGAMKPKDLARAILERARKDYGEGDITCQEALSTVNIVNALDQYQDLSILTRVESGIDAGKMRFAKASEQEELARIAKRLELFVDVS